MKEVVLVIGASPDISRYSYKAIRMLLNEGHDVIMFNPEYDSILGQKVYKDLSDITKDKIQIDTITMYVRSHISTKLSEDIIKLKPKRIIFNPGTENQELEKLLKNNGIISEQACTLVLLSTGQFS